MNICTICSKTNDDSARFCTNCGTALAEEAHGHNASDRSRVASLDPLQARNKIVLMVALLSAIVFVAFSSGVLWMMFKTVQTRIHDDTLNQMLVFTDNIGQQALKTLQAGDMDALQQLQKETKSRPEIIYCFIKSAEGQILTSTFEGNAVPDDIRNINELNKGVPFGTQETQLVSGGKLWNIVDVASGLGERAQGSIHIGWNADIYRNDTWRTFFPVIPVAIFLFVISVSLLVSLTAILTTRILKRLAKS